METNKRDFKFITFQRPGQRTEPKDAFALRSHVRQSIALEKKHRLQRHPLKLRLVPKPASPGDGQPKNHETSPGEQTSLTKPDETDVPLVGPLTLPKAPMVRHPFASIAADHVRIPVERLDYLFKGPTFRQVVEPGFSASHVDAHRSLQVGLPGCFDDAAFLHALVHSMLQASNGGKQTTEQLRLHVQAIAVLNKTLARQEKELSLSTLGAIMALRGAAYKRGDRDAHEQHVRGLSRALESVNRPLTLPMRMALLWQDLYASVLISAPRQLDVNYLSSAIKWARDRAAVLRPLPPGFERHRKVLPLAITGCLQDLIQLDEVVVVRSAESALLHQTTAPLQASEELRLPSRHRCPRMEVIVCGVRLATFILTYVTHWQGESFPHIPGKLAEQLIDILEIDLSVKASVGADGSDSIWTGRRDLQLWLLFVGLNTVHLRETANNVLRGRYAEALRVLKLRIMASSLQGSDEDQLLESDADVVEAAMNDYIYAKGWLECRSSLKEWQPFEWLLLSESATPGA